MPELFPAITNRNTQLDYTSMTETQPKKIGGEYGKVRANIDIEKLNEYLKKKVEAIKDPVDVKQFKVCVFIGN